MYPNSDRTIMYHILKARRLELQFLFCTIGDYIITFIFEIVIIYWYNNNWSWKLKDA